MAPEEHPRATTRVVLDRGLDPFTRLSPDERRRLLVRVLCELVAYDEPAEVLEVVEVVPLPQPEPVTV